MIKAFAFFLIVGAGFGPAYGQAAKAADSAAIETVKQLEHDWSDAQKAGDVGKLSQIIADCMQSQYRYLADAADVDPHDFCKRVAQQVMDRLQSAGIDVVSR